MTAVDASSLISGVRAAGLRVTRARRIICEVLAEHHDEHLTAADLHTAAEARAGTRIDLSTVYRTIEALERVGLAHHVHLGHGPAVVHLSDHGPHHHLVCEVCGRTVDIPMDELAEFTRHLEETYAFDVTGVHFAMVGRCVIHPDTVGEKRNEP